MFLLCPLKLWMRIIIVRVAAYDDVTPEKICTTGNISSKVWQKLQGNQSENSNLFKQYCSCSSISQSCPFSLSFERKGMNFTSRNLNASHPFVNSVWIPGWHQLSFQIRADKRKNSRLGKSILNRCQIWWHQLVFFDLEELVYIKKSAFFYSV